MSWPAVVLAALNVFQGIALAWIALKQAQVKHTLDDVNGHVQQQLDVLAMRFDQERPTRPRS